MTENGIPFLIAGYDGRGAFSHPKDDGFADAVVRADQGDYLLRRVLEGTLLRRRAANSDDWTFFTPDPAPEENEERERWLSAVLAEGRFGRFLCCPASGSTQSEWDHCFLFLMSDGSGVACLNNKRFLIAWSHPEIEDDVRALDPDRAAVLARHVFTTAVNPLLDDPYIDPRSLAEQPIEFICGSKEELAAVTRWICHTEPGLFAGENRITVTFNSSTEIADEDREYFPAGLNAETYSRHGRSKYPARVKELLALAFEYNNFTGAYWEYNDQNGDRQSGYSLFPHDIEIAVDVPSAHERAEALLQLAEWLRGKAPDAERKTLLGCG